MTSTTHPTPLQLPEPQEVLLSKMERVDQNVRHLHPLLDLLNTPEDGKESLGDRLANILLGVKDALERNSTEMAELKEVVRSLISDLEQEVAEITNRTRRMEQQVAQICKVLNVKLD
ncbi:hypothetical protein ACFOHK_03740 [Falsigemmobacter intermedius]|uniref:hypothetical protein n=1 Tax=Falsigemmobacter intermedius TaxID=1553448 RepID=UPI0035ED853E